MSSMSYCRFQNTLLELTYCKESIDNEDKLSKEEEQAKKELIMLCCEIAVASGVDLLNI